MSILRIDKAIIKTLTFAIVHFAVAFSIAYLLTGNVQIASALALLEPLANTGAYYLHEKGWQRLGRRTTNINDSSVASQPA